MINACPGSANSSPKPSINPPTVFIEKSVVMTPSIVGIPSTPAKPQINPIKAVITIPMKTAAGTFFANSATVIKIPKIASSTVGSLKEPIPTNVDSLAMMIPAFLSRQMR